MFQMGKMYLFRSPVWVCLFCRPMPNKGGFPSKANQNKRTLKRTHISTVDGQKPAKPWNDDSPANTNNQWFAIVSKWRRISSIHSICQTLLFQQPSFLVLVYGLTAESSKHFGDSFPAVSHGVPAVFQWPRSKLPSVEMRYALSSRCAEECQPSDQDPSGRTSQQGITCLHIYIYIYGTPPWTLVWCV